MLKTRQALDSHAKSSIEHFEHTGISLRPGHSLPAKLDGNRIVEKRTIELKRLQRQFHGVVGRPSRFEDSGVQSWLSTGYVPAKQRWGPRLERDVHAVCSEAGLPPATATSIVEAASRGTISQNPGVVLSRLLAFLDSMSEPLGRRGVLRALRTAPTLLRYSPDSLRWNADMLAALLPEGTLASVLSRVPMLLPASAITLWGNFEGLRSLLRLDHDTALKLVVRAPRLLLNSRGALEGRLQDLALLAGLTTLRPIAAVVVRQPSLLGYFPGTLERNMRHAAAELCVPFSRVQPLLRRQPTLVMLSQQTLSERVTALRIALQLSNSPADLAAVVLRQPSLLTLAPEAVRQKVDVVERVLGLRDRPPEELAAVLRSVPQVLTLAVESIEAKAAALRAAVTPCRDLAAQLDRAPPVSMALWLCMSATRYDAVRVAAEAAAAAEGQLAAGMIPTPAMAATAADLAISSAAPAAPPPAAAPAVRKRGRPRKHPLPIPEQPQLQPQPEAPFPAKAAALQPHLQQQHQLETEQGGSCSRAELPPIDDWLAEFGGLQLAGKEPSNPSSSSSSSSSACGGCVDGASAAGSGHSSAPRDDGPVPASQDYSEESSAGVKGAARLRLPSLYRLLRATPGGSGSEEDEETRRQPAAGRKRSGAAAGVRRGASRVKKAT